MIYRLAILLFFVSFACFGQSGDSAAGPPRKLTKEEEKLSIKRSQCFHSNKFNAEQRRAFFPFNNSAKIKLISYDQGDGAYINTSNNTLLIFTPLAANNFYVNDKNVKESKILTEAGIDSLTDIMYNIGYTPVKSKVPVIYRGGECYDPRNAIVFINSVGRVTQYIEFCFHCKRYFLSSRKIKNTVYCEQKYDLLKKFFLANGIKYGMVLPVRH